MATTRFNDLVTFSRGSNATVVGPNGLIQYAPANLVTFSEQFDNAAWTRANTTVTANSTAAPDGTSTADTLTAAANTATHNISQANATSGSQITFSVYAKAGTHSFIQLMHTAVAAANFDISAGTFALVGTGFSAAITPVGNGWYRCSLTVIPPSAASVRVAMVTSISAVFNESWTATGTETVFLWGAQLELGSAATTYNPTTVKNLLGFSEAFDNAAWSKTQSSIVTGAQANPINGLFNAQKLMVDTVSSTHRVNQISSATSGVVYTMSVYVKAAEFSRAALREGNFTGAYASFNLSTGTLIEQGAGGVGAITAVGNGWYRISMTSAAGGATMRIDIFALPSSYTSGSPNSFTYLGDGNSGIYIWGAQMSDSASLDPYVPSPGAAPTSVAYYGPRFDHDPVTLAPRGILIEEQRVNLLLQSQDFTTTWSTASTATVVANSTVAPDGTSTADNVIPNTSAGNHYVVQSVTRTAGSYSYTFYAKSAGYNFVAVQIRDLAGTFKSAEFNLSTGVVVATTSALSAGITNVGNGWYRCTFVFDAGTGAGLPNDAIFIGSAVGTWNAGFTGNGTSGVFLWGAQLEAGAFATSYIPTVASQVTRLTDIAALTGSNFSGWYGASEGTFTAAFQTLQTGGFSTTGYLLLLDSNANKRIAYIPASSELANTFDGTTILGAAGDVTGPASKIASAYSVYGRAIVSNGNAVSTGAVVAGYSTGTSLNIGNISSNAINGHIRQIAYYPFRLSDLQLQALTELPLITSLSLDFLNGVYEG